MAKYSEYLKAFLWENKDILDNNDFTELYKRASDDLYIMTGELTNALYTAGIHPLAHMDHIPESFIENATLQKRSFKLPDNITEIERSAFSKSNIKEIEISENSKLKFIDEFAFGKCLYVKSLYGSHMSIMTVLTLFLILTGIFSK